MSNIIATTLDQINVEKLIIERKRALYKFLKEQVRKNKEIIAELIKQVMVKEN